MEQLVVANLNLRTKIILKDDIVTISSILTNDKNNTVKLIEYFKINNILKDKKKLLYFLAHTSFTDYFDNLDNFKNLKFVDFINYESVLKVELDNMYGISSKNELFDDFVEKEPHVLEIKFKNFGYGENNFLINSFNDFPIFIDTDVTINGKSIHGE